MDVKGNFKDKQQNHLEAARPDPSLLHDHYLY